MPKAEASLPSARERRLSLATPAIESTIASRKLRSFSFCPRTNGSSFRGLWFLFATNWRVTFCGAKFFRAPLAFGVLPVCAAIFFVALAAGLAGFFAAGFFARFDALGRAFVVLGRAFLALGRDIFFAGPLDFAGFLELFFFAELAIFGRRPWLAGRERRLTKGHFQPGARRVLPGKNEQKSCSFEALYELALE